MLTDISLIVFGFGLLVVGGEVLVRGAVNLAERLRLSAFVVGAVVIGFGSSMPELVTSIEASLLGAPGIALGNIVGSNIINILVVISVAALISPITLSARHVRVETIVVCVITAAFVAFVRDAGVDAGRWRDLARGVGRLFGLCRAPGNDECLTEHEHTTF